MEIRLLTPNDVDRVVEASHLFDGPAKTNATLRFLNESGHHILIAYEEDHAAGFVTGVETTHPDKGTEMFLYELGVEDVSRRRGIGRALVERLRELAATAAVTACGCSPMKTMSLLKPPTSVLVGRPSAA